MTSKILDAANVTGESPVCKRCNHVKKKQKSGYYRCFNCMKLDRRKYRAENLDHVRKINADFMARCRRDPIKMQRITDSSRRKYAKDGKDKQRAYCHRLRKERPFEWRAKLARSLNRSITASDLRRLWDSQSGLCALTGRPMNIDDAHLDHKIPRSRGGDNSVENLRWLCSQANFAKRHMMDEEFIQLCRDVVKQKGFEV